MERREFFKIGGLGLLSIPFLPKFGSPPRPPASAQPDEIVWIHGSPYLGHSDFRRDFRGLDPDGIRLQIAHFRTAEPWRRIKLFNL